MDLAAPHGGKNDCGVTHILDQIDEGCFQTALAAILPTHAENEL